jgi:thiamine pyrophosphokinase
MDSKTVIVADGIFPKHAIPLGYLTTAGRIICCDGSADNLVKAGYMPDAIVGDMDSLSKTLAENFEDRLFSDDDQDTNDLTKAVKWCTNRGYKDLVIIGATGKREDHTIGNISLLAEYAENVKVIMVTDTGIIQPFLENCAIPSFRGQQISIFSIDPETEISSAGLKYALHKKKVKNWWEATLNEALGLSFELSFTGGPVLVYLKFADPPAPLKWG